MKFLIFCLFLIIFLFEQTNSATIINDDEDEPKLGIVNGEDAAPGEGLHVVDILKSGEPHCGGSLIDSTTVISAAHCALGYDVSKFTIRYGTHKLKHSQYKDISVKWAKSHPEYSYWARMDNVDISIFKLSEPVEEGEDVEFIALPRRKIKNAEGPFTLYGFGFTQIDRTQEPENLQKMTAFNVTEQEYQYIQKKYDIPRGTLLVHSPATADCNGDSGSGLIYRKKLIAVVSAGLQRNCYPGETETFARVDLPENFKFIQLNRR